MGPCSYDTSKIYGYDYTERQLAILNDDIPIDEIRTTELSIIMRKAVQHNDTVNYEIANGLREQKIHPCEYFPRYTIDESMAMLQNLTPWKIQWNV